MTQDWLHLKVAFLCSLRRGAIGDQPCFLPEAAVALKVHKISSKPIKLKVVKKPVFLKKAIFLSR